MRRTVREFILLRKPVGPAIVDSMITIEQAGEMLTRSGDGALLVVQNGRVRGIFTERDFLRVCADAGIREAPYLRIAEVMSYDVVGASPDYTLEQCLMVMSKLRIRHLPVMEGGEIIFVLSLAQIAEVLVEDKEFMIHELVKYISGPTLTMNAKEEPNLENLKTWH